MKNAALCEALPLLATCSHEIPPTPHMVCFAFPPPRIITIPEQTHTFEFASRRAASLSLTHACCVSSLAPGYNNSPEIKTNLLLSHLFLFFLSSYLVIIAFLNFLGQAFQRCFFVLTSTANFHIFFPSCYI
ncbi:ADE_G0054210.mRNA.1.CDS.1 [Saccharomyces cerevisiae]|nr:ADE_G0054210.mRNA.1.CDS.1 [Saccharomyces cerevisiae]CAI6905415.1 ADE_G0054210.mRNA.1.CDS.1 [Saccharomyces cerevisiae]